MDNILSQELADKMTAAKSGMAFMFNPEGVTQAFVSGDIRELVIAVASEMKKSPIVQMVISGAVKVYTDGQIQS